MDNELYEILSAFRDSLDAVNHKLEELEAKGQKVDELEARLENEIIQPTIEKIKHDEEEADFENFHNNYGERLDKYSDMLKSIEGDDFDASREAWKGWKEYEAPEGFTKPESADGYIDAFVNVIENKIEEIKKALNLPEDAVVEVKADEDGVTLEVEGKEVDEAETEAKEEAGLEEGEVDIFADDEEALSEEDLKEIEEIKKEFSGWNS